MEALNTPFGKIEFLPFHFSYLSIVLFTVLGVCVLIIHTTSLMYILKKLNTSNVINSIALFESVANIMGFLAMAVLSLIPLIIGPSSRSLSCSSNIMVVGIIFSTGKMSTAFH